MARPVAKVGVSRGSRGASAGRDWELLLDLGQAGSSSSRAKEAKVQNDKTGQPLFVQISHALIREIRQGRLQPGAKLPSSRKLAEQLGVHRNTVLAAYAELGAEGWIETDPARATFVCQSLPDSLLGRKESSRPNCRSVSPHRRSYRSRSESLGFDFSPVTSSKRSLWSSSHHGEIRYVLSSGTPDLRLLPVAALTRAYRRALKQGRSEVLGYGDPQGALRLRLVLANMLNTTRGLQISESDILITRGAQMAIDLVARVLIRPGDTVAVESFGYGPAWAALRGQGARLLGIPVDSEGMQVAALAELLAKQKIRAVYLTPHHQYPTTVTISASRRLQLLELARRYRFAIIEDDYDHEFHYEGRPVFPLASTDENGVVIYIGTFSKILAPGMRIGYMVAAEPVLYQAMAERMHIDRQGDLAVETAIADLIEDGEVQRHAHRMRRVYHARRDTIVQAVRSELSSTLDFQIPAGGMALWAKVRTKASVEAWAQRALKQGVVVQPSKSFALDQRPGPYLRLGFASLDETEIIEAIARLARSL